MSPTSVNRRDLTVNQCPLPLSPKLQEKPSRRNLRDVNTSEKHSPTNRLLTFCEEVNFYLGLFTFDHP